MTTTTLLQRSRALRRLTIGAAALTLLAAGCAGSTSASDDSTPADGADTQAEEPADSSDAGGADTATTDAEDDQGEGDQGDDEQGGDDQGEDAAGSDPTAIDLPASWDGTILVERLPDGGDTHYVAMENFYVDDQGTTEITAEELVGREFFGSLGADCEGTALLDGEGATCTFTDEGREWTASVRLVHTPFDQTALLILASDGERLELDVPEDAEIAFSGTESRTLGDVTAEEVEGDLINGVMLSLTPEGPIEDEIVADCELSEGGERAICELTGTPDGAGDGTYLMTSQNRPTGGEGMLGYVISRLPAA